MVITSRLFVKRDGSNQAVIRQYAVSPVLGIFVKLEKRLLGLVRCKIFPYEKCYFYVKHTYTKVLSLIFVIISIILCISIIVCLL